MLIKERFVRPVLVGAQLVNGFSVYHYDLGFFVFPVGCFLYSITAPTRLCGESPGVSCSPLGVEGCVGCADGGAVAAFEDEGGAQVRVCRVFAADFCDLFGSQVALGERPQGDRAGHLGHVHAVCVGELARGFDPRAHDAAAVVLLVVLVVAVGEVVSINGERLVVGGSGGTSWEDGRSVDGDMCAVGEGDGVAGRAGGVRVGDLLACEQCVEVSGAFLGGVTVNDVEHVCFLLCGRVFLSGSIVACCGIVCMVCRGLVGRVLGVVLVMLVARVRACGRVVVRCRGSETTQAWGNRRRDAVRLRICVPRVRPRVYPRAPGCLLVGEPDCGVGGGGFAVDDASVAVFDGEAVVCGASAVDAGVEGDGRGVVGCGGVEGDDGGFASVSPGGTVCGCVHACTLVLACGCLFDHGLWRACVSGLFARVLCASAGDPCVGDGSDGVAVREGDGGGVAASFVVAWLVVEGCVYGDGVRVSRVGGPRLARVLAVAVTLAAVAVVVLA